MEFKEFEEYYDRLVKRCQIVNSYNTEAWFNSSVESHRDLNDFFPSDVILEHSPIMDTKGVPPDRIINPHIQKVVEIMPTYLDRYGIQSKDLKHPMLKKPMRIKTVKHILGYAKRSNLCMTKTSDLSLVVSKMGEIWKECKDLHDEQDVLISYNPKSFPHIGCAGVNPGSCWRMGSSKFGFGITKNSFCWYFVSKNNLSPIENAFEHQDLEFWTRGQRESAKDLYTARGLGWIDLENKEICIFNTYGAASSYSYLANVWGGLYKKWFNIDDSKDLYTYEKTGSLNTTEDGIYRLPNYFNPRFIGLGANKESSVNNIFDRLKEALPTNNHVASLRKNNA